MAQRILILNTTGRQGASLARMASAVGFSVRAHVADTHHSPLVAGELAELNNLTIFNGNLGNPTFLRQLFSGVTLVFVNTTAFDDEEAVGKACVDLASQNQLRHMVYSSMPDHHAGDADRVGWRALPQWEGKAKVEQYAREKLAERVTFLHTGIYHNNFTSLPYPLFQLKEMELGPNGEWSSVDSAQGNGVRAQGPSRRRGNLGFEWCAPFPADKALPWLDCEHDFGPAVLQVFKDGPSKWGGKRVPITFDYLTPAQVCAAIANTLNVPVRYVEGPIGISVPVPPGYAEQLNVLEHVLGGSAVSGMEAPYWWSGFFDPVVRRPAPSSDHHPTRMEQQAVVEVARELWPGWRSVGEYAGDAFLVEERLNGRLWMEEDDQSSENSEGVESESEEGLELAAARPL